MMTGIETFSNNLADFFADWGVITVVTVILVCLVFALRFIYKMWPVISKTVQIGDALLHLPDLANQVEKIAAVQSTMQGDVGEIKHEIQTNSGGSLKDEVVRQGKTLGTIERALGIQAKAVVSNTKKLDRALGTLAKTEKALKEITP